MPPFKDEHVLLISPGSQVTLAQLGLPESFTPARFRFPTRMFPAQKEGEFEPYKIHEKRQEGKGVGNGGGGGGGGGADAPKPDVEMKDAEGQETAKTETATEATGDGEEKKAEGTEETEAQQQQQGDGEEQSKQEEIVYEEDINSDEGAVYPIQKGRIVDWPCFFALLTHIHNTLSPPFHTPVMIIAEPAWTARDREAITQFVFEKFKTPAFSLMDAALAVCYGYGTSTATVVDVGQEKTNVTAVTDFLVNEHGRGIGLEGCGGDYMTDRLEELLSSKGFTREMCEQLKRSNITEMIPPGNPLPGAAATARQGANPAASASTGASNGGAQEEAPGDKIQTGGENGGNDDDEDGGVLDVAAIVSGNTSEYLATMEKDKDDKTAAKKGTAAEQAARAQRLPNSKKEKSSFQFEEFVRLEPEKEENSGPSRYIRQSRDIEVGVERFLAASPRQQIGERLSGGILEDIANQIHHTILAVPEMSKRSELWDSLIVVGNGSKIKGFTQALLGVITQKFILSPTNTGMFTSEIPSSLSTPLPTGGANTPSPYAQPVPGNPPGQGVNPLLVAATHANQPAMGQMSHMPMIDPNSTLNFRPGSHAQTPTSVKTVKPPEYFSEWKEHGNTNAPGASGGGGGGGGGGASGNNPGNAGSNTGGNAAPAGQASSGHGLEEAVFLGAQVASKVIFILDQGISKGFMSRVDYNENGPSAVHDYVL